MNIQTNLCEKLMGRLSNYENFDFLNRTYFSGHLIVQAGFVVYSEDLKILVINKL